MLLPHSRPRSGFVRLLALFVASLAANGAISAQDAQSNTPKQKAAEPAPATQAQIATARRARILEIAWSYVKHEWKAEPQHVLHGRTPDGVLIDTPDAEFREGGFATDGSVNIGIPYQWGGASTLQDFDQGLKDGKFAGHLPRKGAVAVTRHAVGVDCSGLIGLCWELPLRQSTRTLARLCDPLESYGELQPGDIVNRFDHHVMLFVAFEDEARSKLRIIEAASPKVRTRVVTTEWLEQHDYVPLRLQVLDDGWAQPSRHSDKTEQLVTLDSRQSRSFTPLEEAPLREMPPEDFALPLPSEQAPGMLRYEVTGNRHPQVQVERRLAAGSKLGPHPIQCIQLGSKRMSHRMTLPPDANAATRLLAFADFRQKFRDLAISRVRGQAGRYRIGARNFPAESYDIELSAKLLVRRKLFPVQIRARLVRSAALPLQGILEAEFRLRWDRSTDKSAASKRGVGHKNFVLSGYSPQ
jgi:cell wall-associated NlpC family hydrolase